MTESELNKYKNVLKAKQAELGQLVRNRDSIAIETSPDALDEVQYAAERESRGVCGDRVIGEHNLPESHERFLARGHYLPWR